MKTRLEWFNTMPEPYRSQAIENNSVKFTNDSEDFVRSLSTALSQSFHWDKTPQGDKYWRKASEGKFPHAVKESNELRVTKDRVLEAAERCSTTKEALKILFPEAFEDDKAVDLTGVECDSSSGWHGLKLRDENLLWFVPSSRELVLSNHYQWQITEDGIHTYLIIKKK